MPFVVVANLFFVLLELISLLTRSEREKEFEILLLRQQLRILQRTQARIVTCENSILNVDHRRPQAQLHLFLFELAYRSPTAYDTMDTSHHSSSQRNGWLSLCLPSNNRKFGPQALRW